MSLPDFERRHSDWSIGRNGVFGQHEQPFVGRETKGSRDKERLREETTKWVTPKNNYTPYERY